MNYDISYLKSLRLILLDLGMSSAIIAGGAIRDMVLSKPIKDIDIFYWKKETPKKTLVFDLEEVSIKYENSNFNITHEGIHVDFPSYKLQLIAVDELEIMDWCNTYFDLDICKVYFNLAGITLTQYFLETVKNKRLGKDPFALSISPHIKRVQEKYPEFSL